MTKRIFRSICLVALSVFAASLVLFMGILYDYFTGVQKNQLQMQTNLAAQGVANEGRAYFHGLSSQDYRITWIDTDGSVLYDNRSDSDKMENHLQREEVKQALANGIGESSRYSVTLMERSLYCAKRLSDGTVVRLSVAQYTMLTLTLKMIQPIAIIFAVALILSLVLASRLAKNIVKPLNALNLDEPLSNDSYDELAPLLGRLNLQQHQIQYQSEELQQKQQEFETVVTGMAEGIVLLNQKRMILSLNPAAERLLDTDRSCIGDLILSVNRSKELQEVLAIAAEGKHAEKLIDLCGGKYQLDASPILSDGQISGTVLLFLDVTEKENAEQIRREFTANVSHELKTPLHTISGYAELMANGIARQEDLPKFSTQIYHEAQRMICLVEDIIKLSHLDEGPDDMSYEEVDLYSLAKETIDRLSPEAENANVQISLEGEPASIYGIPQLLRDIIFNLCDNAIKYNHVDGSVTVTVKKCRDNPTLRKFGKASLRSAVYLSICDTGIGIAPEDRERIFERFYRADKSHSRDLGGTGLGLSIVKHAAKLQDASIDLQSEPGKGTTITLLFPIKPVQ